MRCKEQNNKQCIRMAWVCVRLCGTRVHTLGFPAAFLFQKLFYFSKNKLYFPQIRSSSQFSSDWALNQHWALEYYHLSGTGARVVRGSKCGVYIYSRINKIDDNIDLKRHYSEGSMGQLDHMTRSAWKATGLIKRQHDAWSIHMRKQYAWDVMMP